MLLIEYQRPGEKQRKGGILGAEVLLITPKLSHQATTDSEFLECCVSHWSCELIPSVSMLESLREE